MKFTKEYFIAKFEAIPENEWNVGDYVNPIDPSRKCALGHCGAVHASIVNEESFALINLLAEHDGVVSINDEKSDQHPQPTPKQRILAALRDLP